MDCGEFQRFAHAYIDGEFDPEDAAPLEAHLEGCDACRSLVQREADFLQNVRRTYTPEPAPQALRTRIVAVLEAQDAVALASPQPAPPPRAPARRLLPRLEWVVGPLVASAALAALVALAWPAPAAPPIPPAPAVAPQPLIEEAVTWHRRNLPIEVTGPENARVKRWFDGKVDFPVRLPDFDRQAQGEVNLLGARLGNVKERQAAYVVYEVNGSKLSVIAFDGRDMVPPAQQDRGQPIVFQNAGGYNVALVEDNGITYSITSELPRADMERLVQRAFQPTPPPAP